MKGKLSLAMKRAILKIGEVNHGGLHYATVSALRARGLIEDRFGAITLSDAGFDRWMILLGLMEEDAK